MQTGGSLQDLPLGLASGLGLGYAPCRVQAEVPKPSEGLEYTYARKPSNFDHEKKDLAHIWEVGGSPEFAEEILLLTVKQVLAALTVKEGPTQWLQHSNRPCRSLPRWWFWWLTCQTLPPSCQT